MTNTEINEQVALKLGWRSDPPHGWIKPKPHKDGFLVGQAVLPDYAGSIQAAWEIVDKIKDWELQLVLKGGDRFGGTWYCCVLDTRLENSEWIYERADTAPLAICLAFLKLP